MKICAFLWVYFGYPASSYEGRNVEMMRYKCGQALARGDIRDIDAVAGVPDSGIAHALGYSNESGIPYVRPFVKYTPTWSRSFIPQEQSIRSLVAKMKLIPIPELIRDKRLLFCDDSIVRGTQLGETAELLQYFDAKGSAHQTGVSAADVWMQISEFLKIAFGNGSDHTPHHKGNRGP